MREYNPKHHSRATTFTNSRVKFVEFPVFPAPVIARCCCCLPLLLLLLLLECAELPTYRLAFSFFQFAQKLAAVVEFTLAVCCDVVRDGPGLGLSLGAGPNPGHTSGQVQISFFMSGKIVAAPVPLLPLLLLLLLLFCSVFPFGKFSNMPASRASARGETRRDEARRGKDMVTEAAIDGVAPSNHPQKRLRLRRGRRWRSSPSTRAHNDAGRLRGPAESRNVFNNFHILSNHPQSVDDDDGDATLRR